MVSVPGAGLYPDRPEFVLRDRFDRSTDEFGTWRRQLADNPLSRQQGRRFVVREPEMNGHRFVFVATHRSKK